MKRMIGIRVLTAVLVLAGIAMAFASGCAQREKRETAEEDTQQPVSVSQPEESAEPGPDPTPRSDGSSEAQDALLEAIFDRVSSDEYVLVETGAGGAVERGIFRTFDTDTELKAALEADDSPLRLFDAPDGYELISARAWYDCAEGYEYEPVAEETDDSGLRIKRYTVPEEGRFISWYELEYAAPDGKAFRMAGYLMSEMDTAAIAGEIMESVTVDGMDEALLFRGRDDSSARLEMRQSLAEPFVCVSSTSVADMPPALKDTPEFEEMTHITIDHACYSIRADGMDEALLFRGTDGSSARLEMRQSLAEPFVCVSSTSVAEMPPGFKDSPAYEETTHIKIDHARYSLRADGMDGDTLLTLVTAG